MKFATVKTIWVGQETDQSTIYKHEKICSIL